jgi:hypothetical protein
MKFHTCIENVARLHRKYRSNELRVTSLSFLTFHIAVKVARSERFPIGRLGICRRERDWFSDSIRETPGR